MFRSPETKLVRTDDNAYLFSALTGSIDIVDDTLFESLRDGQFDQILPEAAKHLVERHHLFPSEASYRAFRLRLMGELDAAERASELNFVVVTTLSCNLRCIYCYQGLDKAEGYMSGDMVEAMFAFIDEKVAAYPAVRGPARPLITLMGGEFLIPGQAARVEQILMRVADRGFEADLITNGVCLDLFAPMLAQYGVRHVQVTLDGTREVHDRRRVFAGGQGSFDRIVTGLWAAAQAGLQVSLRVNIDGENVENLPALGQFLRDSGLMATGRIQPYLYGISDGGCTGYVPTLPETRLLARVMELSMMEPSMAVFQWSFHGWDQVRKAWHNRPYVSKNRFCSACKNQWVFGPDGSVYTCFFGMDNPGYRVGSYFQARAVDEATTCTWRDRSVTTIPECGSCTSAALCGGGCTYKAFARTGRLLSGSCADFDALVPVYMRYLEWQGSGCA